MKYKFIFTDVRTYAHQTCDVFNHRTKFGRKEDDRNGN